MTNNNEQFIEIPKSKSLPVNVLNLDFFFGKIRYVKFFSKQIIISFAYLLIRYKNYKNYQTSPINPAFPNLFAAQLQIIAIIFFPCNVLFKNR